MASQNHPNCVAKVAVLFDESCCFVMQKLLFCNAIRLLLFSCKDFSELDTEGWDELEGLDEREKRGKRESGLNWLN